ncbi:MAG: DUF1501 domain-containing protein [Phycisphaerae bacterium]|nr:DUF1501 domain-containing protein [Phycisphaerae bacterium]
MDPLESYYRHITRRSFFKKTATGIGGLALGSLLNGPGFAQPADPLQRGALGAAHLAPKAKRIIYLFQNGAPSQLDLFDYKPGLVDQFDKDLPDSIRGEQRVTGMTSGQSRFPIAPSMFKFSRYQNQQDGLWVSELYPHTGRMANELCVVRTLFTEAINHEPGITFLQTGNQLPGRPSMGSWISYGLGRVNENLPAFVVMISQGFGNMQAISNRLWSSGFLPSEHQGVNFRGSGDPVLFLSDPRGISRADRRRMLDAVAKLNQEEFDRTQDPEILTRIAQYEMAYRMQMSVPELTNIKEETPATLDLYGPEVTKPGSFAYNCLMARRLAERGVRFIQLYNRGWDQHGNLPHEISLQARATDQPQAGLLQDLKQRGMLDDTLVIWGGEFGRTVYCQGGLSRTNYGRDHHPRCFTVWMAGGGVKPGISYGKTDDYGYNIVEHGVSVHDFHATIMHLLGIEHERLTYRYLGRDFRLTDVEGNVIRDLLV